MRKWEQVAIVGVGLIGGSIGLALRKRGLAQTVVGVGRSTKSLETATACGAITQATLNLDEAVKAAELVVVCTPVATIAEHVEKVARSCADRCLITDAGSTKEQIVAALDKAAGSDGRWGRDVRFVGSHPLAGNEKRGAGHASADLFEDRVVVVTPSARSSAADRRAIADLWSAMGARVMEMSPAEHDQAVARTSHVPHVVAAAIAASTPEEYVTLTAGGWLDTTRIAAGDPELWEQILLANRANVVAGLETVEALLARFRQAVANSDRAMLKTLLCQAKKVRDAVGS